MTQEEADKLIEKLEKRYISKAEYVRKLYDNALEKIIEPGLYEVVESDDGGWKDVTQFVIEVEHPITMKDLTLKLIDYKDYMSPWGHVNLRAYHPKEFFIKI